MYILQISLSSDTLTSHKKKKKKDLPILGEVKDTEIKKINSALTEANHDELERG